MTSEEEVAMILTGLMRMAEAFRGVLDTTEAHRAECLKRGFSETASELMAMEVHAALIRAMS